MKRTDADHHVGNLFQSGNPLTGQRGTRLDHTWLNTVQEELAYVVESTGAPLDPADNRQVSKAIRRLTLPTFVSLSEAQDAATSNLVEIGQVVMVESHTISGDGGGGTFMIAAQGAPGVHLDADRLIPQKTVTGEVPLRVFGNVAKGLGADNTADIQYALDNGSIATIDREVRVDGTLELHRNKSLVIKNGGRVRRTADSPSTDPLVWLKGSAAALRGDSQGHLAVLSENRAPRGVVLVGHWSMAESHDNVTYCTVADMTISGGVIYGQTTGEPDAALLIQNPQLYGKASYFHDLSGLRLQQANYGLWLRGYANGCIGARIQGYRLGNPLLGVDKNAFIVCDGALDNAFTGMFFHASPDSIGLLVRSLDNTTNGGSVSNPAFNSWLGMVCEQGGTAAVGLKTAYAGGSSIYDIRHNVGGGNIVPAGFFENNKFYGLSGGQRYGALTVDTTIGATGEISAASFDTNGDVQVRGTMRTGDDSQINVARKSKTNATPGAARVSFILSNTAQASIYRYGYIKIDCAAGHNGAATKGAAWFHYRVNTIGTAYPAWLTLVDSGGDTAVFTNTLTNGLLSIATTQDHVIAEATFGFSTSNVNIA